MSYKTIVDLAEKATKGDGKAIAELVADQGALLNQPSRDLRTLQDGGEVEDIDGLVAALNAVDPLFDPGFLAIWERELPPSRSMVPASMAAPMSDPETGEPLNLWAELARRAVAAPARVRDV